MAFEDLYETRQNRVGDAELLDARLRRDVALRPDQDAGVAAFMQAITKAWDYAARLVINRALGRRVCRICGCWERDACVTYEGEDAQRTLRPCAWAGDDLCTACAEHP